MVHILLKHTKKAQELLNINTPLNFEKANVEDQFNVHFDNVALKKLKTKLNNNLLYFSIFKVEENQILKEFVILFLDYAKDLDTSCEVIREVLPDLPIEYKTKFYEKTMF